MRTPPIRGIPANDRAGPPGTRTWDSTRRAPARTAIDLVRDNVTWGPGFGDSPFFEGEVEPCINGRVVALGANFGERSDRLVDRLLSEQLVDGGWNCEAERGSVRSSFHTTICVLEGLLAFETAFGATSTVTDARTRTQETRVRGLHAPELPPVSQRRNSRRNATTHLQQEVIGRVVPRQHAPRSHVRFLPMSQL